MNNTFTPDTNFMIDFLESSSYSYYKQKVDNEMDYIGMGEFQELIEELQDEYSNVNINDIIEITHLIANKLG